MDNHGNNRLNVFWSRSFIERMTNDTPKYCIALYWVWLKVDASAEASTGVAEGINEGDFEVECLPMESSNIVCKEASVF